MNHLVKRFVLVSALAASVMVVGCAKPEHSAKPKEPQAMTPEQKAARDLQKSNEAVTEIGKKIGRKAQPIDLNLPQEPKTAPASTAPKP